VTKPFSIKKISGTSTGINSIITTIMNYNEYYKKALLNLKVSGKSKQTQ
jgi:hypothetical protein